MPLRGWLRFDLRRRVVLFTSIAVVLALTVLGGTLQTVLAGSLYNQQRKVAIGIATRSVDQGSQRLAQVVGDASRADILTNLPFDLTSSREGNLGFDMALVTPGRTYTSNPALSADNVPLGLVQRIAEQSQLAYVYIRSPNGRGRQLVVGSPLDSGRGDAYQAYFFFPLTYQEQTLQLLRKTLFGVGALLLFAIPLLALVSTRRVLRPVRTAGDVAQRVAFGDLDARIPQARNSDDFGRLAESFNGMTDALAQKIDELEHLSQLQARFASDVSHELRTPLATVRMAADYIHAARGSLPPDAQRATVLLERELERFETLLEDLLEISRFDAKVVALEPVEIDLSLLLDEVVDSLDPVAHGRGVELTLTTNRSEGTPLVAGDPRRLDRVFTNVMKNAVEHTRDGTVSVSVGRRGDFVIVEVVDDGDGIPAEDLPHVFERFYRADAHRARDAGGTGLGLAIALENLHLHGGTVEVTSTVDVGSRFVITLPASLTPDAPQLPPAEEPAALELPAEVVVGG